MVSMVSAEIIARKLMMKSLRVFVVWNTVI